MPRKRMLDPGIWDDLDFGMLDYPERLLFIGLISQADDEGKGVADPRVLRKTIFGFDEIEVAQVADWLGKIAMMRGVEIYEVDDKEFYRLVHWDRYQVINHPSGSRLPDPVGQDADLGPIVDEILTAWAEFFPEKPQPQASTQTIRAKIKARFRGKHFRENYRQALACAAESKTLHEESWFDFRFFVRNDENYQKCLDRWMQWKDKQRSGGNGSLDRIRRVAQEQEV